MKTYLAEFKNFGYIRSNDHCCSICNYLNSIWVSDYKINEDLINSYLLDLTTLTELGILRNHSSTGIQLLVRESGTLEYILFSHNNPLYTYVMLTLFIVHYVYNTIFLRIGCTNMYITYICE